MAATMRKGLRQRFERFARPRRSEPLPVRFDRRRIYILPTAFGWFFLVLLLAMALGALNYNNNPALLLCLLLAGTAIASLLHAQLQLSGLRIVAIGGDPVAAGHPMQLRIHARAEPGRLRRGLRVECHDAEATLSLADGVGEAVIDIATTTRGWLALGRLRVSTTRPLGLARAWSYVWPDFAVLVHPAAERNGPALPQGRGNDLHARLDPAGDDVHHLRAWRRGDSRRAVAWKPSARRGALLVREYEQPIGADVVLDWHALSALPYEDRIRRLAGWVDQAERESRRYRLELPGTAPLGPSHGPQHRHACLRALALMPLQPGPHAQAS